MSIAVMLIWGVAAAVAAPPVEDASAVIVQAREVQRADLLAWQNYRFVRHVERERLDTRGNPVRRDDWWFRIVPRGDSFDEQLIRIGDRDPSPSEIRHHRRAARFAKHYARMRDELGESPADAEPPDELSLRTLLYLSDYRHRGREQVDGTPCHRIDFEPPPEPAGETGKLGDSLRGTLWITVDGHHIARGIARNAFAVHLAWRLVRVERVEIAFQSAPVEGGVWLPRRIEIRSSGRLVLGRFARRNVYSYSDVERVATVGQFPRPLGPAAGLSR